MQSFLRVVERVSHSDSTLLICGETGVGKEHLAHAIHCEGVRSDGPFVAVNCGALPESLLESELFGHAEGAFTGATRSRRGWFELAHRGTIFLDEVGEMPHHLQVKLLRVLQTKDVQRLGGDSAVSVDVRVIAATNRDLKEEIAEKRFRPDLYYRLSVVELKIPALRERREDIPDLIDRYIAHFQTRFATAVGGIADDARAALIAYDWPGNVRELINIVERAMLLSDGPELTLRDLPDELSEGSLVAPPREGEATSGSIWARLAEERLDQPLAALREQAIEELERAYLAALLRKNAGRVGQTAEQAGLQPRSLFEKMKRYGLRKEDFKETT